MREIYADATQVRLPIHITLGQSTKTKLDELKDELRTIGISHTYSSLIDFILEQHIETTRKYYRNLLEG